MGLLPSNTSLPCSSPEAPSDLTPALLALALTHSLQTLEQPASTLPSLLFKLFKVFVGRVVMEYLWGGSGAPLGCCSMAGTML